MEFIMIDKEELNQILMFVAKKWTDLSRDPNNRAVKTYQIISG